MPAGDAGRGVQSLQIFIELCHPLGELGQLIHLRRDDAAMQLGQGVSPPGPERIAKGAATGQVHHLADGETVEGAVLDAQVKNDQAAGVLSARIDSLRKELDAAHAPEIKPNLLAERCVDGLEANVEACARHGEATLAMATALNPYIGYDRATEIVKEAAATGRSLREVAREKGVAESALDEALDYRAMAKPHDS